MTEYVNNNESGLIRSIKSIFYIYKRETASYFYSSIAYVFLALFIGLGNLLFFFYTKGLFGENIATMRRYFELLPYIFVIFIPGLTMGAWAREKNSGTIELLFTLPVKQSEVLLGKFFSALSLIIIGLFSTLIIPVLVYFWFGDFDIGQLFTQYFGAVLMASCYISITFFFSSLTKELINSFLLSSTFLLILTVIGYLSINLTFTDEFKWIKIIFNELSLSSHFLNFSKGVINTRDFFYYIALTVMFFYFNLHSLDSRKWN